MQKCVSLPSFMELVDYQKAPSRVGTFESSDEERLKLPILSREKIRNRRYAVDENRKSLRNVFLPILIRYSKLSIFSRNSRFRFAACM